MRPQRQPAFGPSLGARQIGRMPSVDGAKVGKIKGYPSSIILPRWRLVGKMAGEVPAGAGLGQFLRRSYLRIGARALSLMITVPRL